MFRVVRDSVFVLQGHCSKTENNNHDDSTSAVDTATDSKNTRRRSEAGDLFSRIYKNHSPEIITTIIIAQRVASVIDADRL